jgi:hypothetical protein
MLALMAEAAPRARGCSIVRAGQPDPGFIVFLGARPVSEFLGKLRQAVARSRIGAIAGEVAAAFGRFA